MSANAINSRNWELLFNALEEGRVVPVIGDALIQVTTPKGDVQNINEYLFGRLKEKFGKGADIEEDYSQFETLIDAYNAQQRNIGDSTDLYYEIYDATRDVEVSVPAFLKELFQTCSFPLTLTTSFMNGLDAELGFDTSKTKVYRKSSNSDIDRKTLSAASPSLYYLFGRVNIAKCSFMVTEDDLLDYLHCWHDSDTRPEQISKYLSDKFVLILGCSYPNWLFRFFWHSLKNFSILPDNREMQGVVSLEKMEDDRNLNRFLSRIQTSVFDTAESFIRELLVRYKARFAKSASGKAASIISIDKSVPSDIFISYAKEDYPVVKELVAKMRAFGATVWFDESNLNPGNEYEDMIDERIEQCRRFVPVISETTLLPGRRFFKKEWNKALYELEFHLGEEFIAPIVLDSKLKDHPAIPKPFRDFHIVSVTDEDFDNKIKSLIRSFR